MSIKWHFRMIPNGTPGSSLLVGDEDLYQFNTKTTISRINTKGYYQYTIFESPRAFIKFYYTQDSSTRQYYEIIFNVCDRKIYWDVDMGNITNYEEVKDKIITAIKKVMLEKYGIILNFSTDIALFSSHGQEKKSFHIILCRHGLANSHESASLYDDVDKELDEECRKYLDPKVYNPKQQFRILGSKKGKRYKRFDKTWKYLGGTVNFVDVDAGELDSDDDNDENTRIKLLTARDMEISLVSNTIGVTILPQIYKDMKKKYDYNETTTISEETAKKALEFCIEKSRDNFFPFKFIKVTGEIVILKRLVPSYCGVCERRHDKQDPFLLVSNDKVYFYCRRKDTPTIMGEFVTGPSFFDVDDIIKISMNTGQLPTSDNSISTGPRNNFSTTTDSTAGFHTIHGKSSEVKLPTHEDAGKLIIRKKVESSKTLDPVNGVKNDNYSVVGDTGDEHLEESKTYGLDREPKIRVNRLSLLTDAENDQKKTIKGRKNTTTKSMLSLKEREMISRRRR